MAKVASKQPKKQKHIPYAPVSPVETQNRSANFYASCAPLMDMCQSTQPAKSRDVEPISAPDVPAGRTRSRNIASNRNLR